MLTHFHEKGIAMPSDEQRYIVRRFNWRWAGTCFVRAPGEHRVAWFDTPDEADADRWRRELEVRGRINPFECGPAFHYLSTMPEPIYLDWLMDADVIPPEPINGVRPWGEWWDGAKQALAHGQVAHVWEGLNRVRFFDVITRRPSDVAFAVIRMMWEYNDYTYEPGEEGGEPLRVFRRRENAEAYRQLLEEQRIAEFAESETFDLNDSLQDETEHLDFHRTLRGQSLVARTVYCRRPLQPSMASPAE
jgi:hypothetical protein